MGLILKTKDAQKSHRNFTRTEFIYIFASINEKEIEFNSRFLLFYSKNGENGKHQYEVVKFSQPINNFIRQVVW